ncbi:hypothetical protein KY285_026030 [Solanum tuberosum]|nr:hypothetical protein KY285_026030 [Solanum tuberosum]
MVSFFKVVLSLENLLDHPGSILSAIFGRQRQQCPKTMTEVKKMAMGQVKDEAWQRPNGTRWGNT